MKSFDIENEIGVKMRHTLKKFNNKTEATFYIPKIFPILRNALYWFWYHHWAADQPMKIDPFRARAIDHSVFFTVIVLVRIFLQLG